MKRCPKGPLCILFLKRIKRTWKHNYNRKDFIEVVDSDGSICHILKPKKPEKILWKEYET